MDAVKAETVETVELYKKLHTQCDDQAPQSQHKAFAHLRLSMHARLEAIKGFLDRQRAIRLVWVQIAAVTAVVSRIGSQRKSDPRNSQIAECYLLISANAALF